MWTAMPTPPWTATAQVRIPYDVNSTKVAAGYTLYKGPDGAMTTFTCGSRNWNGHQGFGYNTTHWGSDKVTVNATNDVSMSDASFVGNWVWNRISMDTSNVITCSVQYDWGSSSPPNTGWVNAAILTIDSAHHPDRIAFLLKTGSATDTSVEHRYWSLT